MPAYCDPADLYEHGLPPGKVVTAARLCASALAATDEFQLDNHGFRDGAFVLFRAEGEGSLPSGIAAGTRYLAAPVNDFFFKVRTEGGTPVALGTDGVEVLVIREISLDAVIEFWSSWADTCMVGHVMPQDAEPDPLLRGLVARLSARDALYQSGESSEVTKDMALEAKAILERFATGLKIRSELGSAPANLAITQAVLSDVGCGARLL